VLIYRVINKQYGELSKSYHIMKYVFRLKLFYRWSKLKKKRANRLRERKMKICELIDGEQRYIKGLTEYITMVKQPISALPQINEEQKRLLFSSIVEIRGFHENMEVELRKQYENYNEDQCYGIILKKSIPYFKLYKDYILNAQIAQKCLQDLQKSDK
jgi:hypothetical protein